MINDEKLTEIISFNDLIQVVDIGANPIDGEPPYRPLMNLGLCFVIGFEPQASALANLMSKKGDMENYLPYAIGDGENHTLNICRASGMTSFFEPDQKTYESFEMFKSLGQVIEKIDIDTVRLDDVSDIKRIDFLKIDIQGGELSVFQNGRTKLKDAVFVQTEVSFVKLYKNQPSFSDIDQELRSVGYIPHCFAAIKKWPISPAVINGNPYQGVNQLLEADIVYVKDFTRDESISDDQLKRIILISHYCYGSFDLALRCILLLERRGVIPEGSQARYINSLHARTQ